MKNLQLPVLFAVVTFWLVPIGFDATVRVPKLVGLSRTEAKMALTDKNSKRINNAQGQGTTNNFVTPSASTLVRVPNVVGRLPDVAEDMLKANGLRMDAHGDLAHGIAVCQSPPARSEVKHGSVVVVVFEMTPILSRPKRNRVAERFVSVPNALLNTPSISPPTGQINSQFVVGPVV